MGTPQSVAFTLASVLTLGASSQAVKAADESPVPLVVKAGRPVRVAFDQRITVKRVGQPVIATVIEAVYTYDRIVVPIGTQAIGHIEKLESPSKPARVGRMVTGDLTPLRLVTLQFDMLAFSDGRRIPISTRTTLSTENMSLEVAGASEKSGVGARAREAAAAKISQTVQTFTRPGKIERLREMAINALPYHPQYLRRGTVYNAELLAPLDFGEAVGIEQAPADTPSPPDVILHARLLTPLDSAKALRGTPIRAVLTQPLLAADGRLILPEGAELNGEVTLARPARSFRRNGQLRFLFETVKMPEREPRELLASLHSAEVSQDDHIVLDQEGGARVTNPKTRFIAPSVAGLATWATFARDPIDPGERASAPMGAPGANIGGRSAGGFVGMSVLGILVAQTARPVAVTLGFVGLGRSLYATLLGRGRDVVLPADAPIHLQLSPAASRP